MWSLDSTQQVLAVLLALGALGTLGWKGVDAMAKSYDRKVTRALLDSQTERADHFEMRHQECQAELTECQERKP